MGVPIIGATAATTAATAAAARKRRQEEEEMTSYTPSELEDDWEFKIVRSHMGKFASPGFLEKVCQQEDRAGWTLLEKFDDNRVRFKRPAAARERDAGLPVDAYRTTYGITEAQLVAIVVAATGGGLALVMAIVVLAKML